MGYVVIKGKLVRNGKQKPALRKTDVPAAKIDDLGDKGVLGGRCNRSACLAPGAHWYNHSTRKHYCQACARMLNHANRADALELYGHDLCTKVDLATADQPLVA